MEVIKLGVSSSCLYPEITEKAVKYLCEHNVSDIEIFLNAECETTKEFTSEIKKILDFYGTNLIAVHPFSSAFEPLLLFTNYERRFFDGIELYKKIADFATNLGAKYIPLHGDRLLKPFEDEMYYDRFLKLKNELEKQGALLCQENVNGYKSQNIEFIKKMKEALGDSVSFVFDVKQCVRANQDIYTMLDTMGKNIKHIHISDHNAEKDCILPLAGNFDFEKFITRLCWYEGHMMIEVYRHSYNKYEDIIKSYNQMQTKFEEFRR